MRKSFTTLLKILMAYITLYQDYVIGLKSISVRSPDEIEEAKSMRLHCHFTVEERRDENIYSVLWYWTPLKHGDSKMIDQVKPIPFYRFLQSDDPQGDKKKIWPDKLNGAFTVSLNGSTSTSVYLDQMLFDSEGVFTCEICFLPDFSTFSSSKMIRIARLPVGTPVITLNNKQKRYQDGDSLDLNCSSEGGYPSPNITWFINSEKLDQYGIQSKVFKISISESAKLSELILETYSTVTIPIQTNLIGSGNLKVKCVVSTWNLYHKSNEISVEIIGLHPNPKSIRHLEPTNPISNEMTFVQAQDPFLSNSAILTKNFSYFYILFFIIMLHYR